MTEAQELVTKLLSEGAKPSEPFIWEAGRQLIWRRQSMNTTTPSPSASERAERALSGYLSSHDGWAAIDLGTDGVFVERITFEIAAAELAARPQWLPMETAPRDGTEVLLIVERRAGIQHGMLVGHLHARRILHRRPSGY